MEQHRQRRRTEPRQAPYSCLNDPAQRQRPHNSLEQVVLRLLLRRELVEWDEAGVLFLLGVFQRAPDPSSLLLVPDPLLVLSTRRGCWISKKELHPGNRGIPLPGRGIHPSRLRIVAKRSQAKRPVGLMAHPGNVCDCHVIPPGSASIGWNALAVAIRLVLRGSAHADFWLLRPC